jgi:hypothetical protein
MPMIRLLTLVCVLMSAVACGDDEPVTPTAPTPRPEVTVEFTGALGINGARTHDFNTGGSGLITLTVSELTPNSEAEIGVSLGTWNGATCQIVIARDRATQSAQVVGTAGAAGSYCARVYDAGELKAATDYKITVVHF